MAIFGSSWDDPQTQAILALGAGLLGTRGSFGQALGAGTTNAMQAYQQAQRAQQERETEKRRQEMLDMQMQQQRATMEQAQAQQAKQKQMEGIYKNAFASQTDGPQFMNNMLAGDFGSVSDSRAPTIPQGLRAAQAEMFRQGYVPEAIGLQGQIAGMTPPPMKLGKDDRLVDPSTYAELVKALPDLTELNLGGQTVLADRRDPANAGKSFQRTMTPGEQASNSLGWANYGLAGQRLAMDRQNAGRDNLQSVNVDGQPMVFDKRTGRYSAGTDATGQPLAYAKEKRGSQKVLGLIDQAEGLLDQSTGSYLGAGVDQAARVFGVATSGGNAIAKLKAIQAALMSQMPRMEGPQSDRDTQLYQQAVGMIGDPTIPSAQRKSALETVKEINQRYLGQVPDSVSNRSWGTSGKTIKFLGFE